jgi:hypothetical protein
MTILPLYCGWLQTYSRPWRADVLQLRIDTQPIEGRAIARIPKAVRRTNRYIQQILYVEYINSAG